MASNNASPVADLVIGCIAILVGLGLGLDLKQISSTIRQNNAGFTPWGRRLRNLGAPNPVRVVGWGFFLVGLIALILGLVRAI